MQCFVQVMQILAHGMGAFFLHVEALVLLSLSLSLVLLLLVSLLSLVLFIVWLVRPLAPPTSIH